MTHARPHLTTHGRAKGHSAIGGVAYRLGLKLYDKRTDTWHDYRRRVLNEEIIAAFTLAPAGAPSWATDTPKVWEAVEAAELRKDSQVAHDFRIPVPFGLSGVEAEAMARSMAQHIVDTWATVVSVGVHRDSPVDALGQPKPFGKQGFHAHIYFPTRAMAFDADAVRADDENGQGGSDGWRFGGKLHAFSKKKAASMVITALNAQWATLANKHISAIGGIPDFMHLSYKRLGLDKVGQLRLGLSASAMERKGIRTDKGDRLRAQQGSERPNVVSPVSDGSVAAKINDAPCETPGSVVISKVPAGLAPAPDSSAWLNPVNPIVMRPSATLSPVPSTNSLAGRFLTELAEKPELPQPTPEQRSRLVEWLQRIEQALRRLAAVALRLTDLRDRRQRDDGARATFLVELDDRRKRRADARKAITAWLVAHPWQARLTRIMGGNERKPAELVALEGSAAALNTYVQQLKRGVADAEQRVADLDGRIGLAEQEQVQTQFTLNQGVNFLHGLEPLYGMMLLSVAAPDHVPLLSAALPPAPEVDAGSEATVTFRTPESVLVLKPEPVRGLRLGIP